MIPPLREHREEVPGILHRLLGASKRHPALEPAAEKQLVAYDWPGNLGELEAVAHELVEHHEGVRITAADVDRALGRSP